MKITYKDAGVDVTAGYEAVRLMKEHTRRTYDQNVMTDIGSFGGLYSLDGDTALVSGTDGVGTKLKLAFVMEKHDTVGIDCVAMCANDVVCHGAKPLFFLDYIATGKLQPEVVSEVVKGVSEGCVQAGCALIGGETAEMPGFYSDGEYDMAGFCVGAVSKKKIITPTLVEKGDAIIGLASSGVHSNAFSLVRRLYRMTPESLGIHVPSLGETLGEALLKPTKIYVKTVLSLIEKFRIHGVAHITGGGFIENIPRMLPLGLCASIDVEGYPLPPLFKMLCEDAELSRQEAYNTFNMGIGMAIAVPVDQSADIIDYINSETTDTAYRIGTIVEGERGIDL